MKRSNFICILALVFASNSALALNIDWNGYFRADNNFIHDYQHNMASPGYSSAPNYSGTAGSGEYVAGEGKKNATFSGMFLKLKPKILVNDNVIVHSEWNVGDPQAGFFGRGVPRVDYNNALTTGRDGLDLSVSRLWLDTHTDFGTVQVGRAPMNWGLGVVFHSGDNPWDRYQSTMDTIRLNSKFGYLSLMPLYAKAAMGRSLSGSQNPTTGVVIAGDDDITDYGLGLKYDNPEEELEGGVLYYKRNASDQQSSIYFPGGSSAYTAGSNGMNIKLFDFFGRKVWKRFELKGELPIYSGTIGDVNSVGCRNNYRGIGFATESSLNYDSWKHTLKFGQASGQAPSETGNRSTNFDALYFNRNYKLGNILFRYNLNGFGAANPDPVYPSTTNQSVGSPYDAAIVNARYYMLGTEHIGEQWSWNAGVVHATAKQHAIAGKDYYSTRTRTWSTATTDQTTNLGWEVDTGLKYRWDESITFGSDFGMFFPGSYYAFTNSALYPNKTDRVTAINFTVSTVF